MCVCVMMNHPFPKNIPILRELYAGRFNKLLFLIPFELSDEPDVITVYRGSYSHSGYINDAYHRLAQVTSDHFIFVHDDVMLNPRLNQSNFYDVFPLGRDDGFIAEVGNVVEHIGSWSWAYRFFASLIFPKSMLFGSGVEAVNLKRYLPDGDVLRATLRERGVDFQDQARFGIEGFDDVRDHAAEVLLNGLAEGLPPGPASEEIAADCLNVELQLAQVMAKMLRMRDPDLAVDEALDAVVKLPFPVVGSGFFADCYVVPKARLKEYAHYSGIAAAANLFVEIMAPTLLHACCEKVWTAAELGLEFAFSNTRTEMGNFIDDKLIALHPYKLSTLSDSNLRSAFFETIHVLQQGERRTPLARKGASRLNPYLDDLKDKGWHDRESWGRWAAQARASVDFILPADGSVVGLKLKLRSPMRDRHAFTGRVIVNNGATSTPFEFQRGAGTLDVFILNAQLEVGTTNEIVIVSDEIVPNVALTAASEDRRGLGVGLEECKFV